MGRSQTTFQKRQRELKKIRQREQKAERRRMRQSRPVTNNDDGSDPDLAGITPGPHNNSALSEDIEVKLDGVGGVILVEKKRSSESKG